MTSAPALTLGALLVMVALAVVAGVLAYRRPLWGPICIVFAAPFAWYHQLGPSDVTVNKSVFIGALIGTLAALAVDKRRRVSALEAFRTNPAVVLLAAFAVLSVASLTWSVSTADAAREALRWLWYAGAFAVTVAAVKDSGDRLRIAIALFVTETAVGAYGMWQNATVAPAAFVANGATVIGRIASALEGPNQFGAYLETAIPMLLAALLLARVPRWALVAGGLLLGMLCADLLLTYSRGGLWSCAAAVVFVIVVYAWMLRRRGPERVASPATAAAVAVLAALVILPVSHFSIAWLGWQRVTGATMLSESSEAVTARHRLWACASILIARRPVVGVGAANFADTTSACPQSLKVPLHANADHWYLETAADLGFVGLALLVGYLAVLLTAVRVRSMWSDPVAIGAYAVLIAFVLHGFVDNVMPYPKAVLSFYVLMGMLPVGASRQTQGAPDSQP